MNNSVSSTRKKLKEKLVSQNECLIGVMYVRSYFEYGFSGVPLLYQRLCFSQIVCQKQAKNLNLV